jgi:hypothetical protein
MNPDNFFSVGPQDCFFIPPGYIIVHHSHCISHINILAVPSKLNLLQQTTLLFKISFGYIILI